MQNEHENAGHLLSMPRDQMADREVPASDRFEAMRLAYGLLWHMNIDRSDPNLRLASDARRALLAVMSSEEMADGIARAKAIYAIGKLGGSYD